VIKESITISELVTHMDALIYNHEKNSNCPKEFFRFYIPERLIRYNWKFKPASYKGYEVVIGYEPKIIFVHCDYPLFNEKWMYYEIEL
jgi:hypothetical protein